MNILQNIKPPCTNGLESEKAVNARIMNFVNNQEHIIEESNTIIDWSDDNYTKLAHGRAEENPCYIYNNAVKYAQSLGYTVNETEEPGLYYPHAYKGYNAETKQLDKSKFKYVFIGNSENEPEYRSEKHIKNLFMTEVQDYETFITELSDRFVEEIVELSDTIDGLAIINEMQAREIIEKHIDEILFDLHEYDPLTFGFIGHNFLIKYFIMK